MPKAYILATITIPDPQSYEASGYKEIAASSVHAHGGRFLVRSAGGTTLEGPPHPRVVILEFPDRAAAQAFYDSEQYRPAIALRQAHSTGTLTLLEEYVPPRAS